MSAPPHAQAVATAASAGAPQPAASRSAESADGVAIVHAGIAYKVWAIAADGRRFAVDPAAHVFATGERFEIEYRPNFPGRVDVYNLEAGKDAELIDRVMLDASEIRRLGPYEFGGKPGEEILRVVLHPCIGTAGATRSIRRAELRPDISQALGDCDSRPAGGATQVATRSIRRASRDGEAGLALDPVSRSEIESRRIAPRELELRFRHQ